MTVRDRIRNLDISIGCGNRVRLLKRVNQKNVVKGFVNMKEMSEGRVGKRINNSKVHIAKGRSIGSKGVKKFSK